MSENETEIKKGSATRAFSKASAFVMLGLVAATYAVNHFTAGNWGWLVANAGIAGAGFYAYFKESEKGRKIVNRMEQKLGL